MRIYEDEMLVVLLKGVNDDAAILTELMRRLISSGVQPYYIFQCRPVRGIKKFFQVPLVQGIELIDEMHKKT
jgi:lysine 2,3-aminomutase